MDESMDPSVECRILKRYRMEIQEAVQTTYFSKDEVMRLVLMYYKLQKEDGGLTKEQFKNILHHTLEMTDTVLLKHVMYNLDRTTSKFISLESWIRSMNLLLKSTLEEKIEFCFKVYDITGAGYLQKEHIFNLLQNSIVSASSNEESDDYVRDLIETTCLKMDLDRDGKLSFNDYKQSILKEPLLLEFVGPCFPSRDTVYAFLTTFCHKVLKQ